MLYYTANRNNLFLMVEKNKNKVVSQQNKIEKNVDNRTERQLETIMKIYKQ